MGQVTSKLKATLFLSSLLDWVHVLQVPCSNKVMGGDQSRIALVGCVQNGWGTADKSLAPFPVPSKQTAAIRFAAVLFKIDIHAFKE